MIWLLLTLQKCSQDARIQIRENYAILDKIPMRKSANGQKCSSYKGATMWNRLSLESKLSPTLKTFKKNIANLASS